MRSKINTLIFLLFLSNAGLHSHPTWYNSVQGLWDEARAARTDIINMSDSQAIKERADSIRLSLDKNIATLRAYCMYRSKEIKSHDAKSVLSYLPQNPVLDGSQDYLNHIQTAVDNNKYVILEGSNDPKKPFIYGMSVGLSIPPGHVLIGDSLAVIKRLPSKGHLITLRDSAAIVGVNVNGNKHAHWPEFDNLSKHSGNAIDMKGYNFVAECHIWQNAGTAVQTWGDFPYNLVFKCLFQDCGYIDIKYGKTHYQGSYDKNSGDGIYLRAHHNVALDCLTRDTFRWGYTTSHGGGGNCTYINCDMYNSLYKTYGFIDIEGADEECLLIDCDGSHEESLWQDYRNGIWFSTHESFAFYCSANFFVSGDDVKEKRGDYITLMGCQTIGSGFGIWGYSPVLVNNMTNKSHTCGTLRFDARCRDDDKTSSSFYVNGLDNKGIAANNVLYEELGGPGMDIVNVANINNQTFIGEPTGVENRVQSNNFYLYQNFPNPFNPVTQITFTTETSPVIIQIFNISGQVVKTVLNRSLDQGCYSLTWDGTDDQGHKVAAGTYFYRLKTRTSMQTKKMVFLP